MEEINKKLTDKQREFFNNLSIYIDKPIYFYGSIYRVDYLPGKSDIDIDIFTDNESSTIQILCNHLNINKSEFRKSFYKIDTTVVRGFKGKYKDETKNIDVEISRYNKYVFSENQSEGKNYYIFSKPFYAGYRVDDLVMTTFIYDKYT